MKKLVLMAAVLLGGIAASQAGVSVNIGFGSLFPRPHHVIVGHRPAPVVVAPAPCAPAPVVVAPACPPRYTPAPVVVVPRDHCEQPRYTHYEHRSHGGYRDDHYDRSGHGRYDRDHRDSGRHNGWYGHNSHGGYGYRR